MEADHTPRPHPFQEAGGLLQSRHVRLRALAASDYAWLHQATSHPELAVAWRFRGTTPSPETFVRTLWEGVLAQFIVESVRRGAAAGHVSCYNTDLHSGTAYFAVTAFPPFLNTGLAMEGSLLFLNYLFTNWRLRKIYIETTEFALDTFRSGLEVLREEGRLREHEYLSGAYHDRIIMAIYRKEFRSFLERFRPLFEPTFDSELR